MLPSSPCLPPPLQAYDVTEEGQKLLSFYRVFELPATLIIDPVTGQSRPPMQLPPPALPAAGLPGAGPRRACLAALHQRTPRSLRAALPRPQARRCGSAPASLMQSGVPLRLSCDVLCCACTRALRCTLFPGCAAKPLLPLAPASLPRCRHTHTCCSLASQLQPDGGAAAVPGPLDPRPPGAGSLLAAFSLVAGTCCCRLAAASAASSSCQPAALAAAPPRQRPSHRRRTWRAARAPART